MAEPTVVWMPGEVRTEVHLRGEDTGGGFCLLVDEPPVGWALPAHRHANEAETVHVLVGEFEMEVDGRLHRLMPGDTLYVPRGALHTSANVGESVGRRLVLFSPAGLERFFLEAGAPAADAEVDLGAALAAAVRHGWQFEGA